MIKLFKRDEYKSHGKLIGWGAGPDADWKIMFSVFLFLLLVVAVYSGLSFYQVWQGSFGTEIVENIDSPINKNLIKRQADYYRNKEAAFGSLLKTPETTPDPSI